MDTASATPASALPAVGSTILIGKRKRAGIVKSARLLANGRTIAIVATYNGCDFTIERDA